jgi:hypothetical protein
MHVFARGGVLRDTMLMRYGRSFWACGACIYLDERIFFVLLLVPAWCMDVCRNVDSFPFRQIFAPPICPSFRGGHAEFFRRPCICMRVCVDVWVCVHTHVAVLINILSRRQ